MCIPSTALATIYSIIVYMKALVYIVKHCTCHSVFLCCKQSIDIFLVVASIVLKPWCKYCTDIPPQYEMWGDIRYFAHLTVKNWRHCEKLLIYVLHTILLLYLLHHIIVIPYISFKLTYLILFNSVRYFIICATH